MDMPGSPENDVPRQVAKKLAEIADGILAENLGRGATADELADFAEVLISMVMSSMYCILREDKGAEEAERWLRRTLSLGAAQVRMKGADALVKIDVAVREAPNRLARLKAADPPEAAERVRAAPCLCERDPEGRCPGCSKAIAFVCGEFFGSMRKISAFTNEAGEVCPACQRTEADHAISTLVPSFLEMGAGLEGEKRAAFAQEVLYTLHTVSSMLGVREIPLTERAWAEATGAGAPPGPGP
jgi:hypothetical protein